MTVKITGLTNANVSALRQAVEENKLNDSSVLITATTANFANDAEAALDNLHHAIEGLAAKYGRRGHPVQSLQAVKRKLVKAQAAGA